MSKSNTYSVFFHKTEAALNEVKALADATGSQWKAYDKGQFMLVEFSFEDEDRSQGTGGFSYLMASLDNAEEIIQHLAPLEKTICHYDAVECNGNPATPCQQAQACAASNSNTNVQFKTLNLPGLTKQVEGMAQLLNAVAYDVSPIEGTYEAIVEILGADRDRIQEVTTMTCLPPSRDAWELDKARAWANAREAC